MFIFKNVIKMYCSQTEELFMTAAMKFIKEEYNSFILNHSNYNKTKNKKIIIILGDSGYMSFEAKLLTAMLGGIICAFCATLFFLEMSYKSMWLMLIYPLAPSLIYFILSLNNGKGIDKGINRDFKENTLKDEQMKAFLSTLNQKTKEIYLAKWQEVDDIYLNFEMCSRIAEEDEKITHKTKILESLYNRKETC